MSGKNRVGYEMPVNRLLYIYKPPRPADETEADITKVEGEVARLVKSLVA